MLVQVRIAENEEDPAAEKLANLLFDTALLESGYGLDSPKEFSTRVYDLVQQQLGVDPEDVKALLGGDEEPEEGREDNGAAPADDEPMADDAGDSEEEVKDEL